MVYFGIVALKIYKNILYYADWTNTKRTYRLDKLSELNIEDLKRLFNSRTTVLIVNKSESLKRLSKILGPLNSKKCLDVENTGKVSKILNDYITSSQKKKSYYNYQRDHWLSILSVVNIHMMLKSSLTEKEVLKILEDELTKYNRSIKADELLEKFVELGMFVKTSTEHDHTDLMISIPDDSICFTLG